MLAYYALANASALRLRPARGPPPRWVAVLGLVGCAVLAVTLPLRSILGGLAVALAGAITWAVRGNRGEKQVTAGRG